MRRRVAVPVVVATAAAGLGLFAPTPSSASCAGPQLVPANPLIPPEQAPALVLRPGRTATVVGRFFYTGCEDTYHPGGCGRAGYYDDPQSPKRDVELTLRQGKRSWALGTADAADRDALYAISWSVRVPAGVRPGPATLVADTAERTVTIARR